MVIFAVAKLLSSMEISWSNLLLFYFYLENKIQIDFKYLTQAIDPTSGLYGGSLQSYNFCPPHNVIKKKKGKQPENNRITLQKNLCHHCLGFSEPGESRRQGNCSADAKRGSRLQLFKQWCLLAMPSATEQSCFPPLQQVNLQGLISCAQKWVFSFQIQWQLRLWWKDGFVWKSCIGSRTSTHHEKKIWKWCFSLSDYSPVKSSGRFFCVVRFNHP